MRMCVNMRNRSTGRARLQQQATLIASRCCIRIRSVRSPWNGGGNGSGGESLSLAFQSSSAIDLTVLWKLSARRLDRRARATSTASPCQPARTLTML